MVNISIIEWAEEDQQKPHRGDGIGCRKYSHLSGE